MNLRGKKENVNPNAVLKDKTNVKPPRLSHQRLKEFKKCEVLKENNKGNIPLRARKAKKKDLKRESTCEVTQNVAESFTSKQPYCFGFSDEDDLETDIPAYDGHLTEFDNSKPYRLSLYVMPSRRVRIDPKCLQQVQNWSTLNITAAVMNTTNASRARKRIASESFTSPDKTEWKVVPFASTPKDKFKEPASIKRTTQSRGASTKPLVQRKITEILQPSTKRTRSGNSEQQFKSFFESSLSSSTEEDADKTVVAPSRSKSKATIKTPAVQEAPLNPKRTRRRPREELMSTVEEDTSLDDAARPVHFQKPSRRSYVKKVRPQEEVEDEPPTEEIIKSIEKSKKMNKKASQEEEEFEKWSQSINSVFSEVEQFEMSFD